MATNLDKKVCVVGVGYVGEHLVTVFAKEYNVFGYDISSARVEYLKATYGSISNLTFSTDESMLKDADMYCISVPTLLRKDNTVDDGYVKAATETVTKYAKPGSLVVMESSVCIGMTRTLLGHLREKGVFVAFSPERVDPGRTVPAADEIPKIVAGMDNESCDAIKEMYGAVFNTVVPVSSMETAEMCKLHENCFRVVNITHVNQISDACLTHGIDPMEMINACATKPFGFMPFYPGLGIGGYCLPNNSAYFLSNCDLPLLQIAAETARNRPSYKAAEFVVKNPDVNNVLVVGAGFKPGQAVIADSPALTYATSLQNNEHKNVKVYDPVVGSARGMEFLSSDDFSVEHLTENFDKVVIGMRQTGVDYDVLKSLPADMVVEAHLV